jgi:hypothetical protein
MWYPATIGRETMAANPLWETNPALFSYIEYKAVERPRYRLKSHEATYDMA